MQITGLIALVLLSIATVTFASYREWSDFKLKFSKSYRNDDEESFRYAQWRKSVRIVQDHNTRADMGDHSYWMEINHFADMTDDEFNKAMLGVTVDMQDKEEEDEGEKANCTIPLKMNKLPYHVDWREKGYVTPVKDQGIFCGSCYAFSATGALEGQHFRKTGKLVSLSEQNIIDCTYRNRFRNAGCSGGTMDASFRYVIANGGIDTENGYPYSSWKAVAKVGPVSVGIDALNKLKLYSYGVYEYPQCSRQKVNHGVLAVGYGTDIFTGKQYWLLKNSWGHWWGENGYFKLGRNSDNMCGVVSMASYPIV